MSAGQLAGGGKENADQFPWQRQFAAVRGTHQNLNLLWHQSGSRGERTLMRGIRFDLLSTGKNARTSHSRLQSLSRQELHLK
ncbi:hypothetical protein EDD90_6347 [Streptomyces sp. Ag109_O5-1]|nr:hypothetical protein EDD90_6347 [Streptomyces sp. Ag109_O5-1]